MIFFILYTKTTKITKCLKQHETQIIPSLPCPVQCQPHSKHLEFVVVIIMNQLIENKNL